MLPQLTQTTEDQAQRIARLLRVVSQVLHRPPLRLRVLALLDEIDPLALGLLRLHLLNPAQLGQLRAGGALTLAGVVGYPWADPTQDLAPLMDGTTARQLGLLEGGRWLPPVSHAMSLQGARS